MIAPLDPYESVLEMVTNDYVTGRVKWFNANKGYGFAVVDGEDVFIHVKRLKESGFKVPEPIVPILNEGELLKFKMLPNTKTSNKFYAVDISRV